MHHTELCIVTAKSCSRALILAKELRQLVHICASLTSKCGHPICSSPSPTTNSQDLASIQVQMQMCDNLKASNPSNRITGPEQEPGGMHTLSSLDKQSA